MNQVDPAGDALEPVDDALQVLAAGERVAGVEAEPDVELADRVPQPCQGVEAPRAELIAP